MTSPDHSSEFEPIEEQGKEDELDQLVRSLPEESAPTGALEKALDEAAATTMGRRSFPPLPILAKVVFGLAAVLVMALLALSQLQSDDQQPEEGTPLALTNFPARETHPMLVEPRISKRVDRLRSLRARMTERRSSLASLTQFSPLRTHKIPKSNQL